MKRKKKWGTQPGNPSRLRSRCGEREAVEKKEEDGEIVLSWKLEDEGVPRGRE